MLSVPTPKTVRIIFDTKHEVRGPYPIFTNACIETGIMTCRALIDFLTGPGEKKRQRDDVFIDMFRQKDGTALPLVSLSQIANFTPSKMSKGETLRALKFARATANKGVAHLTLAIHGHPESEKFYQASCYSIRAAIEHHLYEKLGLAAPPRKVQDVKRT